MLWRSIDMALLPELTRQIAAYFIPLKTARNRKNEPRYLGCYNLNWHLG